MYEFHVFRMSVHRYDISNKKQLRSVNYVHFFNSKQTEQKFNPAISFISIHSFDSLDDEYENFHRRNDINERRICLGFSFYAKMMNAVIV